MRVGTIAFSLVLFVSWLALPPPASAQMTLRWNNCANPDLGAGEPPATLDEDFDCTTPREYDLYGTFKTDVDLPSFFAMDIQIQLYWSDAFEIPREEPLEPFWHFESDGCNASGVVLSADKSASGGCGLFVTPWGEHGEHAVSAGVTAYGPNTYGYNGRGILLAEVVRLPYDTFSLHAGTDYYAFQLKWTTDNAATCAGCTDRFLLYWVSSALYSSDGAPPVVLKGSGLCPDCPPHDIVTINGTDHPVTAAAPTWGQIKSQYR